MGRHPLQRCFSVGHRLFYCELPTFLLKLKYLNVKLLSYVFVKSKSVSIKYVKLRVVTIYRCEIFFGRFFDTVQGHVRK